MTKIRLILLGAGLLCVIAFGIAVNGWRNDSREYERAKLEWSRTLAAKDRELAEANSNMRKAYEASDRYQTRLTDLENQRANEPDPVVRVCKRPAPVPAAPESGAASGPHAAAPQDDPQGDAGDRDIGPALMDFASRCEANMIQLEELQRWIRER